MLKSDRVYVSGRGSARARAAVQLMDKGIQEHGSIQGKQLGDGDDRARLCMERSVHLSSPRRSLKSAAMTFFF